MGSPCRTRGAIILVVLINCCYCITKNFVNNSMPEMRPTFVVNFDMGTVICQHSENPADLHLHQMSILCDGKPDCYSNPAMHDESFPYCEGRCNATCNHRGACLFDGVRGQCYCNGGYHGPNCEYKDFNECEDKPCHWLAHCQNTFGSYYCTCFPGFQGDGHDCSDIDECELGLAHCPEHSVCVNLPGTYFCNCTEGFQQLGLPAERCADINECEQDLHDCPVNLKCQNEIGSYKCVEDCDKGFRYVNGSCVDVDECEEKTALCDKRAKCTNTLGDYKCKCEDGFAGNGRTCSPINDCSQQEGICDRHAFCLGSLRMCICNAGYVGDGLSCYDVNECEAKKNPCDSRRSDRCVNIDGGYICCVKNKSDEQCIREKGAFCAGGCGVNAVCYNETCKCMEGYRGDPKVKCEDINECENDKQCLGVGEWCVNMDGGYSCCNPNSKENECVSKRFISVHSSKTEGKIRKTEGSSAESASGGIIITNANIHANTIVEVPCDDGCPKDSHCVNKTCQCNDGFTGNTADGCNDIDECLEDPCTEPDSWCVNSHGSFQCCTPGSRETDCYGLEITGGTGGGMQISTANASIENQSTVTKEKKYESFEKSKQASKAWQTKTDIHETKSESWETKTSKHVTEAGSWESKAGKHEAEGEAGVWGTKTGKHKTEAGTWESKSVGEWNKVSGGSVIFGKNQMNESKSKGFEEIVTVEHDSGEEESGNENQQLGLEITNGGMSSGGAHNYKVEVVNGILQTTTTTKEPQVDIYWEKTQTVSATDEEERLKHINAKGGKTDKSTVKIKEQKVTSTTNTSSKNTKAKGETIKIDEVEKSFTEGTSSPIVEVLPESTTKKSSSTANNKSSTTSKQSTARPLSTTQSAETNASTIQQSRTTLGSSTTTTGGCIMIDSDGSVKHKPHCVIDSTVMTTTTDRPKPSAVTDKKSSTATTPKSTVHDADVSEAHPQSTTLTPEKQNTNGTTVVPPNETIEASIFSTTKNQVIESTTTVAHFDTSTLTESHSLPTTSTKSIPVTTTTTKPVLKVTKDLVVEKEIALKNKTVVTSVIEEASFATTLEPLSTEILHMHTASPKYDEIAGEIYHVTKNTYDKLNETRSGGTSLTTSPITGKTETHVEETSTTTFKPTEPEPQEGKQMTTTETEETTVTKATVRTNEVSKSTEPAEEISQTVVWTNEPGNIKSSFTTKSIIVTEVSEGKGQITTTETAAPETSTLLIELAATSTESISAAEKTSQSNTQNVAFGTSIVPIEEATSTQTSTTTETIKTKITTQYVMPQESVLPTKATVSSTKAPISSTVASVSPTEVSVAPIEVPVTSTEVSVTPMEVHVTSTEMSVTPTEVSVTPVEVLVTSTEVSVTATEVSVTPMEVSVTPTEVSVTPVEVLITSTKVSVTATEVSVTPVEVLVTSTEVSVTATEVSVTPMEVSVTPTEVSVTPIGVFVSSTETISRTEKSEPTSTSAAAFETSTFHAEKASMSTADYLTSTKTGTRSTTETIKEVESASTTNLPTTSIEVITATDSSEIVETSSSSVSSLSTSTSSVSSASTSTKSFLGGTTTELQASTPTIALLLSSTETTPTAKKLETKAGIDSNLYSSTLSTVEATSMETHPTSNTTTTENTTVVAESQASTSSVKLFMTTTEPITTIRTTVSNIGTNNFTLEPSATPTSSANNNRFTETTVKESVFASKVSTSESTSTSTTILNSTTTTTATKVTTEEPRISSSAFVTKETSLTLVKVSTTSELKTASETATTESVKLVTSGSTEATISFTTETTTVAIEPKITTQRQMTASSTSRRSETSTAATFTKETTTEARSSTRTTASPAPFSSAETTVSTTQTTKKDEKTSSQRYNETIVGTVDTKNNTKDDKNYVISGTETTRLPATAKPTKSIGVHGKDELHVPKDTEEEPGCSDLPDQLPLKGVTPSGVQLKTSTNGSKKVEIASKKKLNESSESENLSSSKMIQKVTPHATESSTIRNKLPVSKGYQVTGPAAVSIKNNTTERTTLEETVKPMTATFPNRWTTSQPPLLSNWTTLQPTLLQTTPLLTVYNRTVRPSRCYSSDECTNDAYCERRSGVCRCYPGFVGAPPHVPCVDVNECARHIDDCDPTSKCWNIVGGYTCLCKTGYRKLSNGKCVDIDECSERNGHICHPKAYCTNLPGTYSCQCRIGYTGDGYTCIPTQMRHCTAAELEKLDCGRNHLCLVDKSGHGNCDTCKKGYEMRFGVCSDVNECNSSLSNSCHHYAFCNNIMGSYTCQCQNGFRGDGFWCTDIDECQQNPCHPQASCINIAGSYICKCPNGWIGDGKNNCVNPLDRTCQNKETTCRITKHTSCLSVRIDKLVSVCECDANFRYNSTTDSCEDIDECAENRHNCDPSTSICINTIGGFKCECTTGYEGVGGVCVDVDECARELSGCSMAAQCENHIGSVGCKCIAGYVGDGIECTTASPSPTIAKNGCNKEWTALCRVENKTCHIDDEEVPQCGSCLLGHQPINGKCLSVSGMGNCADPQKNDCDVNAECIDIQPGQHYCSCKVGYFGDGRHCDGPNCHLGGAMCHKNAKCRIDGKCECNSGYVGNGVTSCKLQFSEKQNRSDEKNSATVSKTSSKSELAANKSEIKEGFHAKSEEFSGTRTNLTSVSEKVWKTSEKGATTEHEELEGVNLGSNRNNASKFQTSVIQKCSANDHSPCHILAHCDLPSGICVCRPGYYGDGYFTCTKDWQDCTVDNTICDMRAICDIHTRRCKCIEGYIGDGITCEPDSLDCVLRQNLCSENANCVRRRCVCVEGFTGDGTSCVRLERITDCSKCDANADCVNGTCKCQSGYFGNGANCIPDPLDCMHYPGICHRNGLCDKEKRRCKCIPGFRGDGIDCSTPESCLDNQQICHENAKCTSSGVCQCKKGFIGNGILCNTAVLVNGQEPTPSLIPASLTCQKECGINETCVEGKCVCAMGYHKNESNKCIDINECDIGVQCHLTAKCVNLPGSFMCVCGEGYKGDGKNCTLQEQIIGSMKVRCETDGMTLLLGDEMTFVDGRVFVRGQTDNPYCSKTLSPLMDSTDYTFKVPYSHCNVRYEEPNTFSATVIIQRHPMFITHSADAYELKCTYPVGTLEASSRINVSELATSSSIVEHGFGATCELRVTNENDIVIDTATVGQILHLALSVKPNDTYGILPRNCFAVNLETGERYSLTDKAGCSVDTQLFPEWTYKLPSLTTATFRTFKWPDSSMIRFQCDCSACIGVCPRVNCGRRREAMVRRHRFRYARKTEDINDLNEDYDDFIVNKEAGAFSPPIHVDEDEEEKLAQQEMDKWKYQGLTALEPVKEVDMTTKICIRAIWVGLSLLPLLVTVALVGVFSVLWKRRSRISNNNGVFDHSCYKQKCADSASYLNL